MLDIGVGKAGDLNKWLAAGFKTVVGVDKAEENILNTSDGAYARLLDMKMKKRAIGNEMYVFVVWDAAKPFKHGFQEPIANATLKDITMTVFGLVEKTKVKRALAPMYGIGNAAFDVVSCQVVGAPGRSTVNALQISCTLTCFLYALCSSRCTTSSRVSR